VLPTDEAGRRRDGRLKKTNPHADAEVDGAGAIANTKRRFANQ